MALLPDTSLVGLSCPHCWREAGRGGGRGLVGKQAAMFFSSLVLTLCHSRHMHVAGEWRASGIAGSGSTPESLSEDSGSLHPPLSPGKDSPSPR